jgi:hypothetical protein
MSPPSHPHDCTSTCCCIHVIWGCTDLLDGSEVIGGEMVVVGGVVIGDYGDEVEPTLIFSSAGEPSFQLVVLDLDGAAKIWLLCSFIFR